MITIIDEKKVLQLAFADADYLPREIISSSDIVAAQERYIVPILGQRLTAMLLEGEYQELAEYYVAPALAFATRLIIQPTLNIRLCEGGLVALHGEGMEQPNQKAVSALVRSLKIRTRQLLKRLSAFTERNATNYPEYDSKSNIFNRCSIDGGVVQIF